MKLPKFDYQAPTSLQAAIDLLAADPGARALAGGQSLIPILAFRLGSPTMLVDLGKIPGLDKIEIAHGTIRIGALTRWSALQADAGLAQHHPLLLAAIHHVAHYQIRHRGTVGGSLAHADPAAELPGIAVACEGTIIAHGPAGERRIAAADFFLGALTTALMPGELIVALELPAMSAERAWGFQEFSRRHGDFALAGAAVHFTRDAAGLIADAHIATIGTSDRAARLPAAETLLSGKAPSLDLLRAVGDAAAAEVDANDDLHGSAAYRRALAGTMVTRALGQACGISVQ